MAHISEILQVQMSETTLSPITVLMQRYQASGFDPEFRVCKVEGADHSPVFEATVEVCNCNQQNCVYGPANLRWLGVL